MTGIAFVYLLPFGLAAIWLTWRLANPVFMPSLLLRLLLLLTTVIISSPMFLLTMFAFGAPFGLFENGHGLLLIMGICWFVAALFLAGKIFNADAYYGTNGLWPAIILIAICAAYTASQALMHSENSETGLAIIPAAPLVVLILMAIDMARPIEPRPASETTSTTRKGLSMNGRRFVAIGVIYACVSLAWAFLGGTIWQRTDNLDNKLSKEMASLWGPSVVTQQGPFWVDHIATPHEQIKAVAPASTRATANIKHTNRDKGLLWYSTFTVDFDATYTVPKAGEGEPINGWFCIPLPPSVTGFDALSASIDGRPANIDISQPSSEQLLLPVNRTDAATIHLHYATKGQDAWIYSPAGPVYMAGGSYRCGTKDSQQGVVQISGGLTKVNDFELTVQTDFTDIDYPKGTHSPNKPAATAANGGMTATWSFQDALTNQAIGIAMPHRMNAGPLASRMSFFAPVSLLFFFAVLFTVVVIRKVSLHPMHYLFIAAGFFAFHILLAYLVDVMPMHLAFWVCAAVSTVLVVSYMRLVAGIRFAVAYVGLAQLVYLVGFSYAFFWEGNTGLTVTIGAIVTLFVLMQATGRVNWHEVFRRTPPNIPPQRPSMNTEIPPIMKNPPIA